EWHAVIINHQHDTITLELGETPDEKMIRFRTLGCYPLTGAIESDAASIEEIVLEMATVRTSERQGRVIDHDDNASMEKKKREGYF
ncbi:MAG: sulfate adenylyltransferase small subunit, partial [Pseudomonadota bacterium]